MTRFAIRLFWYLKCLPCLNLSHQKIPNGIKTFSKDYKIKQTQLALTFNNPLMIALSIL